MSYEYPRGEMGEIPELPFSQFPDFVFSLTCSLRSVGGELQDLSLDTRIFLRPVPPQALL